MPDWREEIRRRLAGAELEPVREAEIVRELEQHLDDRFAELRSAGHSEADARRAALDELRDDVRLRRELRHLERAAAPAVPPGHPGRGSLLGDRWQDARYAARMLRRTPGFAITAVLTLAVGIGATVAISSAAYGVLFRPLPLAAADRLVIPVSTNAARGILRGSVPYADYADWSRERDIFAAIALYSPVGVDIAGDVEPERVDALQVTQEYFDVLQVKPLAGRLLRPGDFADGAPRAVVISEGLWKRRFAAAPTTVGSQIRLGGAPADIVGVLSGEAVWPAEQDLWMPLPVATFSEDVRTRRDNMIFLAVARLSEKSTLAQAKARVEAIAQRIAQDDAAARQGWGSDVVPLREYIVDPEIRLGMFVILTGAVFVLLIACVNLANLLLARGLDRSREMAVRSALGASRSRLAVQMVTESLVLATLGGVAGLLAARWLLEGLKATAPEAFPMVRTLSIDGVALGSALVISLIAALLFGLFPALALSTLGPAEALRDGTRTSASRRTGRVRDILASAQMALAVVLLIAAGLMTRSLDRLMRSDPGVDVDRVIAGRIALPSSRYTQPVRAQFYERLIEALESAPGVESAAATSYLPAGGRGFGLGRVFLLEGQPEPPATADHPAFWNVVTPEYFRTLGITVLRGRSFTRQDTAESVPVMMINETMARRVFGETDPIGRRMRSWRDEDVLREIVGVIEDVRYMGLGDEARSLVYVPHRQNAWGSMTVAIRASGDPALLAPALRREVARLDPDVAVARVRTLSSLAADSIAAQRFGAILILLFAGAAALLAGTGVFGVMSYAVAQRRQEFGVRLALGATPGALFGLILRRGLVLAAAGGAIGLLLAVMLAPLIAALLFGVEPRDPATLVTVPLVLLAVALLASAVPGVRAARTDPLAAIRD